MSEGRRTIVVVGGSHSPHTRVPSRMLREAGYRVALADLQPAPPTEPDEAFDAVYPLFDWTQALLLKGRAVAPPPGADYALKPIEVEAPTRWTSYAWRLVRGRLRARRLCSVVRREGPGLVYFQSMTAGAMTAYYWLKGAGWAVRGSRPGLIAHLWGYKPRYPGERRRESQVLAAVDEIHTSSPQVARIYRENFGVPDEKVHVFIRGPNLETFRPRPAGDLDAARAEWGVPADKFVIIHNRHLHPMYRVDVAVDAFIDLARRGRDVFLILVRGSMREEAYEREMLARLASAGLADRVAVMPPILTPDQMAVALQISHAAVNCVPFDAFGVSIVEAMVCRAVPVVRDLESYVQFVRDGETGFAVAGGAEAYADRLDRLIVDPALRERMADAGQDLVRREGSEEAYRRHVLDLVERCWHGG